MTLEHGRVPSAAMTRSRARARRLAGADRRRGIAIGAGLALLLLAGAARGDGPAPGALQHALPGQPYELVQRLLADKVVLLPGAQQRGASGPAHARALVLFEKPRSRVIDLLVQTDRQREYRPDLAKLETVERIADGAVMAQEMRIMLTPIRFWLRYQWDVPAGRISWALDPRFPNDVRFVEGFWELHEVDAEHTVAHTGTQVDVGKALPAFLQDAATRNNLRDTLDRCRRWIDSDGKVRR
jgi:hypothetical protein